jgi:transcriptional regulator with XRE-family HTH domain
MRVNIRINNIELSKQLKQAVQRKRIKQSDLSSYIGITQPQISRILKGKFRRPSKAIYALCTFLNVEIRQVEGDVSLSKYPELRLCLSEILDGSRQRERAIVRLLRSARKLS